MIVRKLVTSQDTSLNFEKTFNSIRIKVFRVLDPEITAPTIRPLCRPATF